MMRKMKKSKSNFPTQKNAVYDNNEKMFIGRRKQLENFACSVTLDRLEILMYELNFVNSNSTTVPLTYILYRT